MCTYTRCNFCDCLQFGPILACLVFENKDVHADLLNAHVQIHPESNGLLGLLTKTFHGQTFSLPVPIRMTFGLLHSASSKKKVYESQWDLQQQPSIERCCCKYGHCFSDLCAQTPCLQSILYMSTVWLPLCEFTPKQFTSFTAIQVDGFCLLFN